MHIVISIFVTKQHRCVLDCDCKGQSRQSSYGYTKFKINVFFLYFIFVVHFFKSFMNTLLVSPIDCQVSGPMINLFPNIRSLNFNIPTQGTLKKHCGRKCIYTTRLQNKIKSNLLERFDCSYPLFTKRRFLNKSNSRKGVQRYKQPYTITNILTLPSRRLSFRYLRKKYQKRVFPSANLSWLYCILLATCLILVL